MLKKIAAVFMVLALMTACGTNQSSPTDESLTRGTSMHTPVSVPTSAVTPMQALKLKQPADLPAKKAVPPKVYSWNPADYTYHQIGGNNRNSLAVGRELLAYKTVPDAKPEENPVELLGFLLRYSDGGKESYYLTPTQLYSKERGVLDATPQQCKVLHVMAKANNKSESGNAQWLRYMNSEKLTEIKFSGIALDDAGTNISFVTSKPEDIPFAGALSNLKVQPDATTKFGNGVLPNPSTSAETMTIKLTFNTGVVYDVWIFDGMMYIFSSDMEYCLGYSLMPSTTGEQRNAQAEMMRTTAEGCYYKLHPELELPERFKANPDT